MSSGKVMESMISEREACVRKLEAEKKALYEANKENVDARDKLKSKSGGLGFLIFVAVVAILISVLFLGSPTKWIVIGVSACALIGGIFGKVQFSAPIKKYNNMLSEYDERVSAIYEEIAGYAAELEKLRLEQEEKLKKQRFEKQYEQYFQNHICVYTGYSFTGKKKPCEKPERIAPNTTIYIDGMEIGDVEKPFTAYEVSPGTHLVKIVSVTDILGVVRSVESKTKQIRVDGASKFVFFHWSVHQNPNGNGFNNYLSCDEFTDIYKFMEASNQSY